MCSFRHGWCVRVARPHGRCHGELLRMVLSFSRGFQVVGVIYENFRACDDQGREVPQPMMFHVRASGPMTFVTTCCCRVADGQGVSWGWASSWPSRSLSMHRSDHDLDGIAAGMRCSANQCASVIICRPPMSACAIYSLKCRGGRLAEQLAAIRLTAFVSESLWAPLRP